MILSNISHVINNFKGKSSKPFEYEINVVDEIYKIDQSIKRKIILKGINNGWLKLNGVITKQETLKITNFDKIEFRDQELKISKSFESAFDQFVDLVLKDFFRIKNIDGLSLTQKNTFVAYLVEYIESTKLTFEIFEQSRYNEEIFELLRDFYKSYLLNQSERKIPEGKELLDKIILAREGIYIQFERIIKSLTNNLYDTEYSKLFRELRPVFTNDIFELLLQPVTEIKLDFFTLLQKVVNLFKKVERESDASLKIKFYIEANKEFDDILKNHFVGVDKLSIGFREIIEFFKDKSNSIAGLNDNEKAELSISAENRTYHFNTGEILIHGFMVNKGKGMAKNVTIKAGGDSNIAIPETIVHEIVIPDSRYRIRFPINILSDTFQDNPTLTFNIVLAWSNENDVRFELDATTFSVERQEANLPWDEIKSTSPYDLSKIDDISKLFGRDKLISDFKFSIESSLTIGSYVIHGQKRVGKSSIVKTLESFYRDNKNVHFIYTEVTERKGFEAIYTFNEIGKNLSKQLIRDFEKKNPSLQGRIQLPSFNGSLSPLIDIVDEIHDLNNSVKIIFAIDEFDELNDEFFENSNIGNVFASNIGKGLASKRFVGVFLIGSENTENKTKQGMRLLNAVKFFPIDSFRRTEFEEYCKIIKNPTQGCLTFSPEVLEILFDYSNGNPFYTNLICDKIFNAAYEKRISYIDQEFLQPILDDIPNTLSTKDFVHFWEDGATDDSFTNKKTFSRRSRVLIAYAEVRKEGGITNWNNIRKKIQPPRNGIEITVNQFEETFNEFIQRKIFYISTGDLIQLRPKLFESWLISHGVIQIAMQLEDKEGLIDQIQQDDKLKLTDEQYDSICTLIFGVVTREGIKLLKDFFDQFENNKEKSLIADLLKQVKVLRSSDLVVFLKQVYNSIWPSISLSSSELNYRKDAEMVCIENSFKQNESYYENIIIKQLHFNHARKLKTKADLIKIDEEIKHIIIYEPLIDCPYYYRNEISKILKSLNPYLVTQVKIHILAFVITVEAKKEIENLLTQNFSFDFSIHTLKIFERHEIAPYINKLGMVNDPTLKCLTKIYNSINENSCLVKIGEIFPYQCFPFLWCNILNFKSIVPSQYSLTDYLQRLQLSDTLKDYYIRSESKKIELKATMAVPGINWKRIQELSKIITHDTQSSGKEFLNQRLVDIQKLWKLELNIEERKNSVNTVKYSLARNLSAFANSEGGDIFIGIEDDFTIIGSKEGVSEEDTRRIFTELVKKYIGVEFIEYFTLSLINLEDNEKIIRIEIKECKTDIWLKCDEKGNTVNDGEQIFIRSEFGTEKLSPKTYRSWRDQRDKKYQVA